ncbi:MAG: corrinoid protein [Deltaproteobacteria bacterium]|nr:corrinoid protein [Deltaproteobacteria bacterium]
MNKLFERLGDMVLKGEANLIQDVTQMALDNGQSPKDILDKGLLAGMGVVGQRFKKADMFIPEVLLSAKTMHSAMEILKPLLAEGDSHGAGTVVIGTVKGDLHDIGKNLVAMMLEGAGFKVVDIGIDQPADAFVEAVKTYQPHIVGMSALLTTTMPVMADTIKSIKEAGLRDTVKVIAGGAPVTREYVAQIGADGYGTNAADAVEIAKLLVGAK